jgi:hypothetical protein
MRSVTVFLECHRSVLSVWHRSNTKGKKVAVGVSAVMIVDAVRLGVS